MKKKIHICDICGRDIYSLPKVMTRLEYKKREVHPIRIKIRRYNDPYGDDIFPWDKVEVCTDCAKNIYEYCKENKRR